MGKRGSDPEGWNAGNCTNDDCKEREIHVFTPKNVRIKEGEFDWQSTGTVKRFCTVVVSVSTLTSHYSIVYIIFGKWFWYSKLSDFMSWFCFKFLTKYQRQLSYFVSHCAESALLSRLWLSGFTSIQICSNLQYSFYFVVLINLD